MERIKELGAKLILWTVCVLFLSLLLCPVCLSILKIVGLIYPLSLEVELIATVYFATFSAIVSTFIVLN